MRPTKRAFVALTIFLLMSAARSATPQPAPWIGPGLTPIDWSVIARSLIPAGASSYVWNQCGSTILSGSSYVSGGFHDSTIGRGTVHCRLMKVDDTPRRYVVYAPPFLLARPQVVFMFHGSGGSGEIAMRETSWIRVADRTGVIVVFATGLEYHVIDPGQTVAQQQTKWNTYDLASLLDPARPDWRPPQFASVSAPPKLVVHPWPADDVKFTLAIIEDLAAAMPIDRCAVYASGFSNGGAFMTRLAVDAPDSFAAGSGVTNLMKDAHTPKFSIPIALSEGTNDQKLIEAIIAGGDTAGATPSADDLLNPTTLDGYASESQRIDATTQTFGLSKDNPTVTSALGAGGARIWMQQTWSVPAGGTGEPWLQWRILRGITHRYPVASDNPYGFDAAESSWTFFTAHPKRCIVVDGTPRQF
jgi:poly(3-hydroxybutyrate) depolymerase